MKDFPNGWGQSGVRKAYPPQCSVPRYPSRVPPSSPMAGVLGLQPNPAQTELPSHPLLEPGESVTAEKVGAHTPQSWKKLGAGGEGSGAGGGAASGCATLSSPHSSSLACSAPAARPPPCGWPAGHKVRQGWTAPALISGVPSFLQLPGSPEICKVCPRWCLQSAPTCPKVFPNLERAGKGGGMGRAEVCRQRVRVSP